MAGIRGIARRLSWGLGDQAVSSMSNFAVGVFVARELGVAAFGIFSLAWVTYGVVLNVSRGLATDPLVVRFSGVSTSDWRTATARAGGTAIAVGVAFGVVSALAGLAMGGTIGGAFVALGVVAPGMLLQDCWRFAFFAAGHGHKAFVNDVVWAVTMIPLLVLATMHGSVWGFVLAWGGSAWLAAGYGWLQSAITPHFAGVRDWLHTHRALGARYMVENVSNSGASQLRMYGLGALAGLADVGAVRGAELLLGPFLALLMGSEPGRGPGGGAGAAPGAGAAGEVLSHSRWCAGGRGRHVGRRCCCSWCPTRWAGSCSTTCGSPRRT